jgi:hypothetical protein
MCDIDAETRRIRYAAVRKMGYTRGWAQRTRDFSDKRYNDVLIRKHDPLREV